MVITKYKILAIVLSLVLICSTVIGLTTYIVITEINKGKATTETDYAVTVNLFNTNRTINSTAVTQLLAAINYNSYTASRTGYTAHNLQNRTSNNSGNTIIFPMGYVSGTSGANLYWQATYLYNGYLTVWLDKNFINTTWDADWGDVNYNTYPNSDVQVYLDDTFWPLLTQNSATLRGIFATPAQVGYQELKSGITNDTSYYDASGYTSRFDNMSTTVGQNSYLWLPSFGEVCNNTTSAWTNGTTSYTGQWGLNSTDRSFNRTNYSSGTTRYCWLRSGYSGHDGCAMQVHSSGYFLSSMGSGIGTVESRGVRPAAHISLSALQQYVRYNVTTAVTPAGAGTASGGGTNLSPNSSLTLTATATNSAYEFVCWSTNGGNSIVSTSNPLRITVTQDATYTAVFRLKSYTVTTNTDGNGSITASSTVTHGGSYTVTATPTNDSYEFDYFILNNDTSNLIRTNPYTIQNITANTTITAYFKLKPYNVSITTNDSTIGNVLYNNNLTNSSNTSVSTTQTHGSNLTNIYAIASGGNAFAYWQIDRGGGNVTTSTANPLTVDNITTNTTITAFFTSNMLENVAVVATYGGSVELLGENFDNLSPTDEIIFVSRVKITGYRFVGWYDGDTLLGTDASIRLPYSQVQGKLITAKFELINSTNMDDTTNNTEDIL